MKIGIIGSRGNAPHDEAEGLDGIISSLNRAGESSVHFDPMEGSDEPNPGQRTLNRQRWRQTLYRRHKEVDLLHCLHLNWSDLAWCGTTAQALKKPTIASVDGRLTEGKLSFRDRSSVQRAIETISCFIAADEPTAQELISLGCSPDRLRRRREFNAPATETAPRPLPADMTRFIQSASTLFVASGPMALHQTQDQAGFDLLIEALAILNRQGIRAHLLAVVENAHELTEAAQSHWDRLRIRIPQAKLEEQVFWHASEALNLLRLLPHAKALVRPTNHPEDPIILHRALQAGFLCIASDAGDRPGGSTLFRNRDALDLARILSRCIQAEAPALSAAQPEPESLLSLYRALLSP
jgi:hypothetical protein